MSPLTETILSILLAVIVLIAMFWVFGYFKTTKTTKKTEEQEPANTPEEENNVQQEIIEEEPEETLHPFNEGTVLHPADDVPSKTVNGRTYSYTKTNTWISMNGIEYYQLIESNSGSRFFINKDGKRVYLSSLKVKNFIIKSM